MARDADVVIVGGGPAGLSTAIFLAHADPKLAERIVVLEKERYPRDKYCAGGIGARADLALARAGVVVSVPSVHVAAISLRFGGGEVSARGGEPIGRVVRRIEFDHALARIAKGRGVRVVEGARVDGLAVEPTGVSVRSAAGEFRARVLVGADGVGSVVRRSLGLPAGRLRAQVIELDTEPVDADGPRDVLHFDASDRALSGYAWDFPTIVDGRELVCRGVYHLKLDDADDTDIRALLAKRLADRGLDLARHHQKRFAERGFELHQPYAVPRVALVGEAAGIDPVTGEGIAQAIQYGAFAGGYLAEKLASGDLSFADWNARLARTDVGLDLGVRTRVVPWFFGRYRAAMERFLLETPSFLALGARYFAGRHVPRWSLAKVAAVAGWHTLRAGASSTLRAGASTSGAPSSA